jgi:hypothetical protein
VGVLELNYEKKKERERKEGIEFADNNFNA